MRRLFVPAFVSVLWLGCQPAPAGGPDAAPPSQADAAAACPPIQEPESASGELVRPGAQALAPSGDVWADFFGGAVAIHGNIAVVAATRDNGYGDNNPLGGVYIYERGAAATYEQRGYFGHDGSFGFGYQVATDGTIVAVSAPGTWSNQPGSVHVFENSAGEWQRTAIVQPEDEDSYGFGVSLVLDKGTLLVGQPGRVLRFRRDDSGTWRQSDPFGEPRGHPSLAYGYALAVHNDTMVVSDLYMTDGSADPVGGVYVYRRQAGAWRLTQKLRPPRELYLYEVGTAVALHGNTLVVASAYSSSVLIYEREGNGPFCPRARFVKPGRHSFRPDFGRSVAVYDDVVVVGQGTRTSPGEDFTGHVFVYRKDTSGQWQERLELAAANPTNNLGVAVALWQNTLLVGDDMNDVVCPYETAGGCNAGAAYIFSLP